MKNKNENWASIHSSGESWRKKITGQINDDFIVPRYVKFFYSHFGFEKGTSFLEIGSGNGDMSLAILNKNSGQIGKYVVSEYFPEGVEWLKSIGLDAVQADAQNLPYADNSFDVCVEFDVMHHVTDPRAMASEMMRVARGRCLLTESNGLSIFRKIKELSAGHRAAGEKSFTPRKWKSFFEKNPRYELKKFEVFPFLFPFKTPKIFHSPLLWWNHVVEKLPFIKWQCSSLAIYIEYMKNSSVEKND